MLLGRARRKSYEAGLSRLQEFLSVIVSVTAEIALDRIELYTQRVKEKLDSGDRRQLVNSMSDLCEIAEIARRLYARIEKEIKTSCR
jgi:hypothetical protein